MTESEAAPPLAAFELSDEYDIRTFAGSVADRTGKMFDLAAELEQGNGRIEVADEFLVTTFDTHPALVRVEVEVDPNEVHYSQLNREPLNEYAASIGIENPESYRRKGDLIAAVDDKLAAEQAGEEVPDADDTTLGDEDGDGSDNTDPSEG